MGRCEASTQNNIQQECLLTARTENFISHSDNNNFVVNLYALHNAEAIRNALPANLTRPQPLHNDREQLHFELAAKLRVTQTDKRAKTQEKRKATMAAKKAQQQKRLLEEEEGTDVSETEGIGDIEDHLDYIDVHGESEPDQSRKRRRVN